MAPFPSICASASSLSALSVHSATLVYHYSGTRHGWAIHQSIVSPFFPSIHLSLHPSTHFKVFFLLLRFTLLHLLHLKLSTYSSQTLLMKLCWWVKVAFAVMQGREESSDFILQQDFEDGAWHISRLLAVGLVLWAGHMQWCSFTYYTLLSINIRFALINALCLHGILVWSNPITAAAVFIAANYICYLWGGAPRAVCMQSQST